MWRKYSWQFLTTIRFAFINMTWYDELMTWGFEGKNIAQN